MEGKGGKNQSLASVKHFYFDGSILPFLFSWCHNSGDTKFPNIGEQAIIFFLALQVSMETAYW